MNKYVQYSTSSSSTTCSTDEHSSPLSLKSYVAFVCDFFFVIWEIAVGTVSLLTWLRTTFYSSLDQLPANSCMNFHRSSTYVFETSCGGVYRLLQLSILQLSIQTFHPDIPSRNFPSKLSIGTFHQETFHPTFHQEIFKFVTKLSTGRLYK